MRKPRGRNLFTKNNVKRAITIAREAGVDRVEIDPEGRIILTGITKTAQAELDDKPEDIVELLK